MNRPDFCVGSGVVSKQRTDKHDLSQALLDTIQYRDSVIPLSTPIGRAYTPRYAIAGLTAWLPTNRQSSRTTAA